MCCFLLFIFWFLHFLFFFFGFLSSNFLYYLKLVKQNVYFYLFSCLVKYLLVIFYYYLFFYLFSTNIFFQLQFPFQFFFVYFFICFVKYFRLFYGLLDNDKTCLFKMILKKFSLSKMLRKQIKFSFNNSFSWYFIKNGIFCENFVLEKMFENFIKELF